MGWILGGAAFGEGGVLGAAGPGERLGGGTTVSGIGEKFMVSDSQMVNW